MNFVWATINLEDGNRLAYQGNQGTAMRVAAALVGNGSYAHPPGSDIYLYGRGDGSTAVMVRQLPLVGVEHEARMHRAADRLLAACKAVLDDLSFSTERDGWCAGPWADPASDNGQGGKVHMLRAAVQMAETGDDPDA